MSGRDGAGCEAGRLVRDEATGLVGTLMFLGDWEDPSTRTKRRLAFIRPERGGREWTTAPDQVTVLPPAASRAVSGAGTKEAA